MDRDSLMGRSGVPGIGEGDEALLPSLLTLSERRRHRSPRRPAGTGHPGRHGRGGRRRRRRPDGGAVGRAEEAGRDLCDRRLSDLIGEPSTRSEELRVRWAAHDVKFHRTGVKRFHHPVVGDVTLTFEALALPADPGQQMLVCTPEPASASAQAIGLLASWAGAASTIGPSVEGPA